MTLHDFEVRENTGWVICKKCGMVQSEESEKKQCIPISYDEE